MRISLIIVLTMLAGCGQAQDDCQRAFQRIARISTAGFQPLSGKHADEALEACRRAGRTAKLDPVVRCAMDSTTDGAAAYCIDQLVRSAVVPSDDRADGSGVNPLLDK